MAQVNYAVRYKNAIPNTRLCAEKGELILFQDGGTKIVRDVMIQFTKDEETCFAVKSNYCHPPILITTMEVNKKEMNVRVLSPFEKCMDDFVQSKGIYMAVRTNNTSLKAYYTFTERVKTHLLEVLKGIKALHTAGVVHGDLNGRSMILVGNAGTLVGKVVSSSAQDFSGTSQMTDDWKSVESFVRNEFKLARQGPLPTIDHEIQHWLGILNTDNITDNEVVDHIALWPISKKVDFIQVINDYMKAGNVLDDLAILGTQIKTTGWHFQFEEKIRTAILKDYGLGFDELIRFVRNMAEHGEKFDTIKKDIYKEFSFDAKGIFAMIDDAIPGFFVKLLEEAKNRGINIPT